MSTNAEPLEVGATEFKANCLKLLDQVHDHKIPAVVVTKHGKPVARLCPLPEEGSVDLFGSLKGSATIPPGVDLTEPLDEEWEVLKG
ncbi:type II toxin-antitoxin system Phd/YefM family antitoxin [Endothiovibrio diazotrophicus]